MTFDEWVEIVEEHEKVLGVEIQFKKGLWNLAKKKVRQNLDQGTETVGFDVLSTAEGYRIVEGTTQVPFTPDFVDYHDALQCLWSILDS